MRLLFIIPEYQNVGGGISTFYEHLLPALARRGHEVKALVGSAFRMGDTRYSEDGVEVEYLKPEVYNGHLNSFERYAIMPQLQRDLAAAWALYEQANAAAGFDAVEVVDWGLMFVPWVISSDAPPVAVQMHASTGQIDLFDPDEQRPLQNDIVRQIERGLLPLADVILTLSKSNQRFWREMLTTTVDYFPPAYAVARQEVSADRSSKVLKTAVDTSGGAIPPGAYGFVAGRIQYWKGPEVLCRSLRMLGDDAPVVYWAGGDKPYSAGGRSVSMSAYLADKYPDVWEKYLKPVGLLPREQVLSWMRGARFGVVPSIWDVYNYTCVEMMAVGTPVVCSAGAGAHDLLEDEEAGFVCASNDEAELAEAIRRVSSLSESERERMGEKAAGRVREQLDPDTVAAKRVEHFGVMTHTARRDAGGAEPWLRSLVEPSSRGKLQDFLEDVPLRTLIDHVAHRLKRRIRIRTEKR